MAPHFARNPHLNAAMVRAWVKPGASKCGSRPDDGDGALAVHRDQAGHPQPFTAGCSSGTWIQCAKRQVRQDGRPFPAVEEASLQRGKPTGARRCLQDHHGRLLSPEPKAPGMLPLWEELFANARMPKGLMLESLAYNQEGDRKYLFRRALDKSTFGKGSGRMPWRRFDE